MEVLQHRHLVVMENLQRQHPAVVEVPQSHSPRLLQPHNQRPVVPGPTVSKTEDLTAGVPVHIFLVLPTALLLRTMGRIPYG